METLDCERGAGYRTQLLTRDHAEQFAACLEANPLFQDVEILESPRAKGDRRWYVAYAPATEEAREALLHRQQDRRIATALVEFDDYLIVPSGAGFYWVQGSTGHVYEVTDLTCTCGDFTHRCQGNGLRCKHQVALRAARREGRIAA
jgi:SWIM zinc finger